MIIALEVPKISTWGLTAIPLSACRGWKWLPRWWSLMIIRA